MRAIPYVVTDDDTFEFDGSRFQEATDRENNKRHAELILNRARTKQGRRVAQRYLRRAEDRLLAFQKREWRRWHKDTQLTERYEREFGRDSRPVDREHRSTRRVSRAGPDDDPGDSEPALGRLLQEATHIVVLRLPRGGHDA